MANLPNCVKCKTSPTHYTVGKESDSIYRIKCLNCNISTPWYGLEETAIRHWCVELKNNIIGANPIKPCRKCRGRASLISIADEIGIPKYTVRCEQCKTSIRFARKLPDSVIDLWNKIYGV